MGRFTHVSLVVDLDHEPWPVPLAAFTDTARYLPRRSRTILHEAFHVWHQLTFGSLFLLAEEDWVRMRAWENGAAAELGPRRAHFREPRGRHGFSTNHIAECLARFWEVWLVGPHAVLTELAHEARSRSLEAVSGLEIERGLAGGDSQESLDIAMRLSGTYAAPYAVARHALTGPSGPLCFAFAAHAALSTDDPALWFERFVASLGESEALRALDSPDLEGVAALQERTRRCFATVVGAEPTGKLLDVPSLWRESALRDNPAYAWAFTCAAPLFTEEQNLLDRAVSLPVQPDFRRLLPTILPPPCIRFREGALDLPARHYAQRQDAAADASAGVAAACLSLEARWTAFQDALRRH